MTSPTVHHADHSADSNNLNSFASQSCQVTLNKVLSTMMAMATREVEVTPTMPMNTTKVPIMITTKATKTSMVHHNMNNNMISTPTINTMINIMINTNKVARVTTMRLGITMPTPRTSTIKTVDTTKTSSIRAMVVNHTMMDTMTKELLDSKVMPNKGKGKLIDVFC